MKRDNAKRSSPPPLKPRPAAGTIDIQESSVPDEASKAPAPFDVRTVKALAALMTQHDLSEIDLRDGNQRVRLRRGAAPVVTGTASAAQQPVYAALPPSASPANSQDSGAASKKLIDIKSQTVGTFYAAANPGAEPFVKVGSKVSSNSVVGLIEAMKLFNEINAECSGVVVEILVENQQPVEFGQVLMRVDPGG